MNQIKTDKYAGTEKSPEDALQMIIRRFWNLLISLDTAIWLLAAICLVMAMASFRLQGDYAASINSMPLLRWLLEAPLAWSWWLWLTLTLLVLLAINTVCCSTEVVLRRYRVSSLSALLAPQMIHAGFLLIMLAHLGSAIWGYHETLQLPVGQVARLPDGRVFALTSITPHLGPMDMPLGFSAELLTDFRNMSGRISIAPNKPWLVNGYGVYIKHAEPEPVRWALLEIHREPGAGMALAGALLFSTGNLVLLALRARAREP